MTKRFLLGGVAFCVLLLGSLARAGDYYSNTLFLRYVPQQYTALDSVMINNGFEKWHTGEAAIGIGAFFQDEESVRLGIEGEYINSQLRGNGSRYKAIIWGYSFGARISYRLLEEKSVFNPMIGVLGGSSFKEFEIFSPTKNGQIHEFLYHVQPEASLEVRFGRAFRARFYAAYLYPFGASVRGDGDTLGVGRFTDKNRLFGIELQFGGPTKTRSLAPSDLAPSYFEQIYQKVDEKPIQ